MGIQNIGFIGITSSLRFGRSAARVSIATLALLSGASSLAYAAPAASSSQASNDQASQERSQSSPQAGQPRASGNELEEVLVTAERRNALVTDVPASISVISGKQLQEFGISDFSSFATLIPSLSGQIYEGEVQNRGPRTIGLRGVQTLNLTFLGGQNTVGFYINDTPVSVVNPRLVDLQRVEVLRGPQGTLYGSNSLGGAIKLVTAQPDSTRVIGYGSVEGSSSRGGGLNGAAEGSINIPLGERAALRASAYYEHDDGWIDLREINVAGAPTGRVIKDANDNEAYGGMVALRLDVSDNVTITPSLLYSKRESANADFYNGGRFTQFSHFLQPGNDRFYLPSVTFDVDLGVGTLTSTTAYFDMSSENRRDLTDFFAAFSAPRPALLVFDNFISQKEWTHETRFVTDFEGPLQLTTGVFYADRREVSGSFAPANGVTTIFGLPTSPQFGVLTSRFVRDRREIAVFGEATYALTDRFKVTGGVRWFDAKYDNRDLTLAIFTFFDPTPITASASQSKAIFRGRAEFKPTDESLIYANVAQGYRIGGANPILPSICNRAALAFYGTATPERQFNSDSLTSYELGGKFARGNISVTGAAYHIDWSDTQIPVTLGGQCPLSGYAANAGSVKIDGGEFELSVRPFERWQVSFTGSYTNARVGKTLGFPGATVIVASRGDRLPDIAKWQFSATSDYGFPISNTLNGYVRADYRYTGGQPSDFPSGAQAKRKAVNIVNLRLGATTEDQWDVSLFADNLFDDKPSLGPFTFGATAGGGGRFNEFSVRPRTVGARVSKRY